MGRILIVDDERDIVELLSQLLTEEGHQTVTEEDGDSAMARVKSERFDVLLIDKNIPGPSGLDVIRAATEIDPQVECILMTGYGSMESAIAAMEAGAFDYILKPFNSLSELTSRVRRAMDRHLLKKENRSLVEFLGSVVRSMSTCLLVVDQEAKIRAINPPALRTLGLSEAQAPTGGALEPLLGAEGMASLLTPSERKNDEVMPRETSFVRPDGRKLEIGFTSTKLVAADGSAAGSVVTFRDLSELKRAQDTERRRDRLASLGEMSARIAHEVRNPLVSIDSVVRLLDADLSDAGAKKDLATISREVRRLHGIVSEILQFARPRRSTPALSDPAVLARTLATQVEGEFKTRQVTLAMELPPELPPASFDSDRLHQVLLNLLLNALDASPAGTKVALRVRSNDKELSFLVEDAGPGLSPEALEKLFTPFFSTKSRGTGLGLAVSRGIVEEHGGKIEISNRAEGGARAVVTIPR